MIRFHTVAVRETHNWDSEWLADHAIKEAFGLYLIREGEATYLCEITPSSAAIWVGNRFILTDAEEAARRLPHWEKTAEEKRRETEREEAENENSGSRFDYLRYVNVEKHNPLFIAGPLEIDPTEDLEGDPDGDCMESEIWDLAAEYWGQSPDEPLITWPEHFEIWEAEQIAKRRAENVPPLSSRGDGQLPLFVAAALPMLPNGQPTLETNAAFAALKWI